ncbi:hypothetical protein O3Q51_16010 [Cryomorphaceae bacterium 1068]|nr:hypothetical protein [Cryomorphaceae bacterium 1068]
MTKIWTFIISLIGQIILAVVLVGLLVFFNPGDIFSKTKHTLKDTPILVRSMKQIGQLITAEYYGETVADNFTVIEMDDLEKEEELLKVLESNDNFAAEIDEMRKIQDDLPRNKRKLEEHYLANYSTLGDGANDLVLLHYYLNRHDKPDRQKLLQYLVKTKKGRDKSVGEPKSIEKHLENYYAESATPGKVKKKELLVIVGRGWVKAGYDFGEFDPNNFIYSESQKRIYISGMSPFMEVTMNPWFIPEKGVEGFEFIMMGKEAAHNRKTVLETKKKCKTNLIKQAEDREILQKARENAQENLRAFISLMMDVEIVSVQIHESLIDSYRNFFAENDSLSLDEFRIIEMEFLKNGFRDTLKGNSLREYRSFEKYLDWIHDSTEVRYSKQGFVDEIASDGRLDLWELEELHNLTVTAFDSVWYGALKLEPVLVKGSHIHILRAQNDNMLSLSELEEEMKTDLAMKIQGAQYMENDTIQTVVDSVQISLIIDQSLRLTD